MIVRTAWTIAALATVAVMALPARAARAFDERARHDYVLNCSGCHRSDGTGVEGTVPSFDGIGPLLATDAGRAYLVRVPGVAHAPVDDARLAALLNYVVAQLAGQGAARPFTGAEVARYRREPLVDPIAARRRLLPED